MGIWFWLIPIACSSARLRNPLEVVDLASMKLLNSWAPWSTVAAFILGGGIMGCGIDDIVLSEEVEDGCLNYSFKVWNSNIK